MPVAGYRLQVNGCRLLVPGFRLPVAGYRLQVSGCRLQVLGFRLQVTCCRLPVTGCMLQAFNDGTAHKKTVVYFFSAAMGRIRFHVHLSFLYGICFRHHIVLKIFIVLIWIRIRWHPLLLSGKCQWAGR